MGMGGNQDEIFYWILTVAMVLCYGFTGGVV